MNRNSIRASSLLSCIIIFSSLTAHAQDTLKTKESRKFTTIGFQASYVSGIGISFGYNQEDKYRFRVTGGLVTTDNITYYSFGIEYEIGLTRNKPYRVFIGPGFGTRGQSDADTHTTIGLGTGFETSLTGSSIFENVTAGSEVDSLYPITSSSTQGRFLLD
jgi:hypothetical protein